MDVHKARVGVTSFDAELAYEEQGLRLGSESDHSIGNHDVDSHPSARAPDCSAPTTYHLKVRSFHPLFLLRAAKVPRACRQLQILAAYMHRPKCLDSMQKYRHQRTEALSQQCELLFEKIPPPQRVELYCHYYLIQLGGRLT